MALMHSIVFAIALMLVVLVQQGAALKCFECNSHNDTRCAMDIPPEELSFSCQHPKTICRKVTQEIEYSLDGAKGPDRRVIRTCGSEEGENKNRCYIRSGFGGRQVVCACNTSDNCNSSTSLSAARWLVLPLMAIVSAIAVYF